MKHLYLVILLVGVVSCNNLKTETAPTEPETQSVAKVSSKYRKSNAEGLTAGASKFMRNKKINNTTKGAAIGAVVGGITGAAVSKNKPLRGAVIGGAIGAGAGALTGRAVDNKQRNGRIFKNGLFGRRNRQ